MKGLWILLAIVACMLLISGCCCMCPCGTGDGYSSNYESAVDQVDTAAATGSSSN